MPRGSVEGMRSSFVTTRAITTIVVSIILGVVLYQFSGDPRMSLFVFLATAFCGYMYTMISVATREE
ncbi:hypothetical protein CryarDRAFT_2966 [Cryptosporangium arvum DSM 44712]|uniref:Uncharacterized protein n=2 Tax=Cryptosporangium TaxID=65502 RepID=A0A010YNU6_9ACTN|nr:hypothetical protein CryarDRAFT_2966 [Cryptosporangium arvum DSM 44712]